MESIQVGERQEAETAGPEACSFIATERAHVSERHLKASGGNCVSLYFS